MGKKAIFIIIPLVIAGLIFGLGFSGVVNIPGITPKKAMKKKGPEADAAKTDAAKPEAKPVPKKSDPPPVAKAPRPKPDVEKGAAKLATVWGEMKPDDLVKIAVSYKDADLALILKRMDDAQVASLLSKMEPARAVALSKALATEVSKPVDPTTNPSPTP